MQVLLEMDFSKIRFSCLAEDVFPDQKGLVDFDPDASCADVEKEVGCKAVLVSCNICTMDGMNIPSTRELRFLQAKQPEHITNYGFYAHPKTYKTLLKELQSNKRHRK